MTIVADGARPVAEEQARAVPAVSGVGLGAATTWFPAAAVTAGWPDVYDLDYTPQVTWIQGIFGMVFSVRPLFAQRSQRRRLPI